MQKPLLLPLFLAAAGFAVATHSACSSSAPATYERGTLVRPPAPAQRPGVGAPVFDPHGPSTRPDVQPQPRPTRILPETPETRRGPGIWASDAPPEVEWDRVLMGVNLPIPDDAIEYDKRLVSHCAASMRIAAEHPDRRGLPSLSKSEDVRCLTAALYALCARGMVLNPDPVKAARHKAIRTVAEAFFSAMCTEDQRKDPRIVELLSGIGATWARANLHTSVPLE